MAHVKFIGKGKVDGREYDRGNTLDVDEATKSRLLKEGCIEGGSDDSELKQALEDANEAIEVLKGEKAAAKNELETAKKVVDKNVQLIEALLLELKDAKKIADYEAIKTKYTEDTANG